MLLVTLPREVNSLAVVVLMLYLRSLRPTQKFESSLFKATEMLVP